MPRGGGGQRGMRMPCAEMVAGSARRRRVRARMCSRVADTWETCVALRLAHASLRTLPDWTCALQRVGQRRSHLLLDLLQRRAGFLHTGGEHVRLGLPI